MKKIADKSFMVDVNMKNYNFMKQYKNKKLLVLGGAFQHCQTVAAAKRLGVIVYVADYLEKSPAKNMADKSFLIDVKDIEGIVKMCKEEHIDGVINTSLDPCQIPYQKVCERLGLPCFGTQYQFYTLTNKQAFKEYCTEHNVDIIPSYSLKDFSDRKTNKLNFPVLVKPADSRGSRGQSVAYDTAGLLRAVDYAKTETKAKDIIIEKYMKDNDDFTISYLVFNGEVKLIRTADRYLGSQKEGLDRVAIASKSPSKHSDMFMEKVNPHVIRMLQFLNIKNGPVFIQGFIDNNTVRFYDPGFRFAGGDYEQLFLTATGIDLMQMLIIYALSGKFPTTNIPDDIFHLNGRHIVQLCPALWPGKIKKIYGQNEIITHKNVYAYSSKYIEGDTVPKTKDIDRRFAEISILSENPEDEKHTIKFIQNNLHVTDVNGNEMVCNKLDISKL